MGGGWLAGELMRQAGREGGGEECICGRELGGQEAPTHLCSPSVRHLWWPDLTGGASAQREQDSGAVARGGRQHDPTL